MKRMLMELNMTSKTFSKSETKKKEQKFSFDFKLNVKKKIFFHFRNKNILRKELGLDGPPYTSLGASFPVVIAFSGSVAKKS